MQSNITELLDTCKMFDEKFITLVAEAEKKKDVNLIKEANTLKRSSDEKVYYPSSRSREEKRRELD